MKYLHTMVRVANIDASLKFYCEALGLRELKRMESDKGRFTLVFLAAPGDDAAQIELTYNWDPQAYGGGRNFGHVAYEVDDIYATCRRLQEHGVTINRPPREGKMAFVRSPDGISVELLQKGAALAPAEPWASMPNVGEW
ncbi:MAG: VOC family protein [Steroidobacteraceae bacterium]